MKLIKKMLVMILVITLAAMSTAFANDTNANKTKELAVKNDKEWKTEKNLLMVDKKNLQDQFGALGEEIEELETEIEEAEATKNTEEIDRLKNLIEETKSEMTGLKEDFMGKISDMKNLVRGTYTDLELKQLEKVGQGLKKSCDAILPVEHIFFKNANANVKFDTPPVIKEGRTLIPVRAISEAMGAIVTYKDGLVTIVKSDTTTGSAITTIKFNLNDDTVEVTKETDVVTTETFKLDMPAEIMNNRTMVPLRFIAEQLGLKVQYAPEAQFIEVAE